MGRQALLFGKLSSMVVLISVICSLAHGSKGSVAYHPKELPSKLSYIPSFLYRIFLPRTSDAPSGGMSMDHLARAQAPSSLTPHGQTEIGYAKSPSSTMPHALPPIEEEKHKFGFHGKLPRTGTSPPKTLPKGSVSPLPIALPPKSVPPTPAIQGPTAASIPLDAMSPQINIRQEHSRGSSPSDKNQRPQIHPRKGHAASRASLSHSNIHGKRHKKPDAASSVRQKFNHSSPATFSPTAGLSPAITPTPLEAQEPPNNAFSLPIPSPGPPSRKRFHSPGPESSFSSHEHHTKKRAISSASAPTHLFSPPPYYQGPVIPEAPSLPPIVMPRKSRHKQQGPPPLDQGPSLSPTESLFPPTSLEAPAPLPVIIVPSPIEVPVKSPMGPSPVSSPWMPQTPAPSPIRALPPPPPNQDCLSLSCMEPFTYNPPGSPCGCVLPMQVELRLGVTLLTFFPLVSELAKEIAAGVSMKQSQVRIIGANAASQEPDKTEVHLDLVPLGKKMNKTTAFLIYEKFWLKLIVIKTNFFGDYQVLYVHYPGAGLCVFACKEFCNSHRMYRIESQFYK